MHALVRYFITVLFALLIQFIPPPFNAPATSASPAAPPADLPGFVLDQPADKGEEACRPGPSLALPEEKKDSNIPIC